MPNKLTNVVVAGLGGQGVLKASDILANVAARAGFDVKKSEIKGMSQRGGSVSSEVRFGDACSARWCRPARRITCSCSNRRRWTRTNIISNPMER